MGFTARYLFRNLLIRKIHAPFMRSCDANTEYLGASKHYAGFVQEFTN